MLKSTFGHVKRHLYTTSSRTRLVTFTGDDLWYSVRGGALNSGKGGFGGDSILRERIDFWENTSYGHGGAAKIWAGLNHDHGKFEEGKTTELGPVDRDRPVFKKKEDRQLEAAEKEAKFLEWTREYYLNKQNMGWSNHQICGRYIPNMFPADAIKEFGRTFDDFRCCILDMGRVSDMVPKLGRIYKQRITVMVGNGKGVYGIATVQTDDVIEGIALARTSAFRNLQVVNLDEGRTISSDGIYIYHKTRMYLRRQPQGYGINGNRVTKRMADLIGLKDISIDVNGSHNPMSLINCFCRAIEEPETDQERADLNGYYVVEIDPQRGDKPKIVAEPRKGKRSIPFPQQYAFFHQRINHKQFHNAMGIFRNDPHSSRYWNFVHPGRTGSGYAGFLEYKRIPEELTKHVKPAVPAPRKKCHTNLARSGLDSEQIEAALAAM